MAIVTKEYLCNDCGEEWSVDQPHNKVSKTCKFCKSKDIDRLLSAPIIAKDGEPKTLGTFAERNTKRNPLSAEKAMGPKPDKEKVAWQQKVKKLNKMTPEKKEKYIMTGEMS